MNELACLQLKDTPTGIASLNAPVANTRQAVALGAHDGPTLPPPRNDLGGGGGGGGGMSDEDALQARLDNLRK